MLVAGVCISCLSYHYPVCIPQVLNEMDCFPKIREEYSKPNRLINTHQDLHTGQSLIITKIHTHQQRLNFNSISAPFSGLHQATEWQRMAQRSESYRQTFTYHTTADILTVHLHLTSTVQIEIFTTYNKELTVRNNTHCKLPHSLTPPFTHPLYCIRSSQMVFSSTP